MIRTALVARCPIKLSYTSKILTYCLENVPQMRYNIDMKALKVELL